MLSIKKIFLIVKINFLQHLHGNLLFYSFYVNKLYSCIKFNFQKFKMFKIKLKAYHLC